MRKKICSATILTTLCHNRSNPNTGPERKGRASSDSAWWERPQGPLESFRPCGLCLITKPRKGLIYRTFWRGVSVNSVF